MPEPFKEEIANEILERVCAGETVRHICKGRLADHLQATDFYAWLRDPKAKVGEGKARQSLASAYAQAVQDRALMWQDMAIEAIQELKVTDHRWGQIQLKQAQDNANLLLRMAKETRDSTKAATGAAGDQVHVTIRMFGAPEPEEPALEGELE